MKRVWLGSVVCVLAACGDGGVAVSPVDAGFFEASAEVGSDAAPTPDAAALDEVVSADASGISDGSVSDVSAPDASGISDGSTTDVSPPDASAPDASGIFDGSTVDGSSPDASGISDGSTVDAGAPDASVACPPIPACDAPPPAPGATVAWRHLTTRLTVALGSARHRGRDLFLREGEAQWALAKFAYGLNDDDLNDEDVDLYLLRDCTRWEMLGTARTSLDSAPHAAVEGVNDTGGRVYFEIPAARRLAVGWHRVRFVVRGDHTVADQWIRVIPAGARVVVSDVDGTLTESENAALLALLTGPPPGANAGGAAMLQALVARGWEVFYLTARPEWLAASTHDWLTLRGFPRGIVHTTLGLTGATGAPAQSFKTAELAALRTRFGRAPDYGFGNTDSDVGAYVAGGVAVPYYYRYTGDVRGGTRVDDYTPLAARFSTLAPVCR